MSDPLATNCPPIADPARLDLTALYLSWNTTIVFYPQPQELVSSSSSSCRKQILFDWRSKTVCI